VVAYHKLKAFRQAEEILPELLRLADSRFLANRHERVTMLNTAAAIYIAENKYSQTEPILREAVSVGRSEFVTGHPLLGSTLRTYSEVLEKMNRKDDAIHIRAEAEVLLVSPPK
jgi:hypothetical protein